MEEIIDPRWAWDEYKPSPASPWDLKKVGHLYRRAAFGANWAELQAGLEAGPSKAIDQLLKADGSAFDNDVESMAESIRRANNGQQIKAWWLYKMMYSPAPLREKLALFWHNHFATSNGKVQNAGYMLGQYALMHKYALGNFRELLQEMSKDPAMMFWLDTVQSKKGMPNENYARELMELFSLGIGHYTETDIREAAKAFTGWTIKDGKANFDANQFDDGEKKVIGKTGKFKSSDVVEICLDQKACAPFIVRKLYSFLISESGTPDARLIEPLAEQFRQGYDFGKLVATVLRSNLFFSPHAYRARIKSPVEFALGIVRGLEGKVGTSSLADAIDTLGQSVFNPPSVKGWDGGPTWLNGQTLLFRQNLALALTSTEDVRFAGRKIDPARLAAEHDKKNDIEAVDFFLQLFLQGDVPPTTRERLTQYVEKARSEKPPAYWTADDTANHRVRAVCHLVLTVPEFQLD
jgi:uncharacterized protein (DUF1800 family)